MDSVAPEGGGSAWTGEDVSRLFVEVKNWGRWGRDDEKGTLNFITPEVVAKAALCVRSGRTVSCSRNFPVHPHPENPFPAQHHMVVAGDDPCVPGGNGLEASMDYIGIAFHGMASTHIDALCHVFVKGEMYNGWPATDVRSTGATRNSIMCAKDGIVGRGVLLDLPRFAGSDFLDPAEEVEPAMLDAAASKAELTIESGDIVLIRTGRDVRRERVPTSTQDGQRLAGLHPSCLGWLHSKQVAVLGGDGVHDPLPGGERYQDWPIPIHMGGLVGMGLHLLDNLWLEDLATACAEEKRWAFQFVVAPLRIERGTGSPINPLAIL